MAANAGFLLLNATAAGPTAGFDPVLISLIRRSMPNLVAYDLAGVQPMNGPTGLIFAMRSRLQQSNWYRSVIQRSRYSILQVRTKDSMLHQVQLNINVGLGTTAQQGSNPLNPTVAQTNATDYNVVRV